MKKIFLIAIAFVMFAVPLFASVVTIEGKSVLIPDDPAKAKEKALDSALRKSVEAFLAEKLTKPTVDANYAKLQPAFYNSFKDFVTKYEVVEERSDAQFLYIKIRADIDDAKINGQLSALGIQPGVGGKPKVAVFASEQNVDSSWTHSYFGGIYSGTGNSAFSEANFNICEGTVMNAFSNGGFPVIDMTMDPSEVKSAYKYKPVFDRYDENLFNMPPDTTAKVAKIVDNEVGLVVTCSALAKNQGKKSAHMNSIFANVSCKVVDVKNNSRVANAIASAAVPHIDPITGGNDAIKKACEDVAQKLLSTVRDRY